jgi:hypothetical protein
VSGDGGCRSGGLTSKIIRSLVAVCSKLLTSLARLKLINSWLTASPFSPDVIRPRRRLRCRRKQGPIQFLEYNPVQSSLWVRFMCPQDKEKLPPAAALRRSHTRAEGHRHFRAIHALDRAAFRSLRNGDVPFLRPPFQPALKLLGNVAQRVPAHRVMLPVGVEEADDALRLLERLNQRASSANHPNIRTLFTSFRYPHARVFGCSARVARNAQSRPRIAPPCNHVARHPLAWSDERRQDGSRSLSAMPRAFQGVGALAVFSGHRSICLCTAIGYGFHRCWPIPWHGAIV